MINHKIVRPLVALALGSILALYAYQRVTDPGPGLQRAKEEAVVLSSRVILRSYVGSGEHMEIVDPVSPNRKVGKVYVYPAAAGWEVSGHYRRGQGDPWHPFLMSLSDQAGLESLMVEDTDDRLVGLSLQDPKFSAVPP